MTARRPRFNLPPRGLTHEDVAGYLGHGPGWLTKERLEKLYAMGFPQPDSFTGRFDLVAIDAWYNQRSGLIAETIEDGGLMRRLQEFGNGQT